MANLGALDYVSESTVTTGTDDFELAGAVNNMRAFGDAMSNDDTVEYAAYFYNGAALEWETGVGTYVSATNRLARTTILTSSNANAKVSFSAGTKTVVSTPLASRNADFVSFGYAQNRSAAEKAQARANTSSPLNGHLFGLTSSNNSTDATNDIDIAVGEAASTETNPVLMVLASALTKQLDADWAAGTNQGGRYSGVGIADGTYHGFLASKANGADPDIYLYPDPADGTDADSAAFATTVLTALQAETGGSAYAHVRRITSILRESGTIVPFLQVGDDYFRSTASEYSSTSARSNAPLALSVPTGVVVRPRMNIVQQQGTGGDIQSIIGPGAGGGSLMQFAVATNVASDRTDANFSGPPTDTSAQVYFGVSISGGTLTSLVVYTAGWKDARGRN